MDTNTINNLRKTSSGLGFMLFAASITMYTISLVLQIIFMNKMDNAIMLLMDIVVSIISLFSAGIFYCWFSSTSLSEVIKVKWVKPSLAVPLIILSLAVSMTADYLTQIIQSSFSIFGVENSIDFSTKSPSLFESILNITAIAVIPALVEEFLFRGIVLGKLRNYGDAFALFMSSILFSLMHGNIVQIPFTFIVGLTLSFITIKTNSLIPAILVHFLVNFRSVIVTILTDNNIISETTLNIIYVLIVIAVIVLGIVLAAILSKRTNFFKLGSREDISYRQTVKTSIFSVGMIFFIINSIITTLQTISINFY